jgi:hypothetical protein
MHKELYSQLNFPVLQNCVYETHEKAVGCATGNIRIVEDQNTGLVYNADFDPNKMVYNKNYNNEQGISRSFQSHLTQVAQIVKSRLGSKALVEIGCGKGLFLEMLVDLGIDIQGIDPAYEGKNPRISKRYFEPGITEKADGIILRHVLEHILDPVSFLRQIAIANKGTGFLYIEVPCFEWICRRRAWYDIFYEHVNYFRISDFERIFEGLIESGHFFGGQYFYIIADVKNLRNPVVNKKNEVNFPKNFDRSGSDSVDSHDSVIWGGASKGVIFSLLKMRQGKTFRFAIDINPAKQGKYLPGSGLKVWSPQEGMKKINSTDTIYVMNSNYMDEIHQYTNGKNRLIPIDHE